MKRLRLSDFKLMFVMLGVFAAVAVGFWRAFGNIFYLYNFGIIGVSVGLGMGLWPLLDRKNKPWARRLSQVLVGGYMFFGLGLGLIYLGFGAVMPENMQIEGFWFMVFAGVFQAAAIHYFVAKIAGPAVFNRGWCGWTCWTAAVLDLLPWKRSPGRLPGRWGRLRYLHFALALALTSGLVFLFSYGLERHHGMVAYGALPFEIPVTRYPDMFHIPEVWWFLLGNLFYYASGIGLAAVLKDNRAFCKYVCPIVGFLKPAASVSVMRIGAGNDRCTRCRACERVCPMDIEIVRYVDEGKRVLSTECILCLTCTSACPEEVLGATAGLDLSRVEYLRPRRPVPEKPS